MISKAERLSLKLLRLLSFFTAVVLLCSSLASMSVAGTSNRPASDFGVKQYDDFHDVLHPLEHEALPQKDFARIRSNARELVKRGRAIVKLGVPRGTATNNTAEFRKELKKFNAALAKFSKDARNGTDGKLEAAFSSVHDSFEMLVGMLPRKR
jgi:hypothetical protein